MMICHKRLRLIVSVPALALAAMTFGSVRALLAQGNFPIVHEMASVDGKVGVGFWPKYQNGTPMDLAGCHVQLMVDGEEDLTMTYDCGVWFSPPPGRYRLFLESADSISPFSTIMKYSGSPYKGRGVYSIEEMVPGGTVRLALQIPFPENMSLRLLHVDSHNREQRYPQRELVRRASGEAARRGVLMPWGSVVTALYDRQQERYVALGRPVEVVAGQATSVEPRPPGPGRSALLVVAERGQVIDSFLADDLQPLVMKDGVDKRPDVLIPAAGRVYALWYDLPAGPLRIRVDSAVQPHPPIDVELGSEKVEHVQIRLPERPSQDG